MKIRFVEIFIVFLVILGVTFERLTLPETTDTMHTQALEYGEKHGKVVPPQPFVYDGCTFFFDTLMGSDFNEACFKHDIAYWYGGSKEERVRVDKEFRDAVHEGGMMGVALQHPVYATVRIFGDSILTKTVNANWGFGWN